MRKMIIAEVWTMETHTLPTHSQRQKMLSLSETSLLHTNYSKFLQVENTLWKISDIRDISSVLIDSNISNLKHVLYLKLFFCLTYDIKFKGCTVLFWYRSTFIPVVMRPTYNYTAPWFFFFLLSNDTNSLLRW